MKAILTLLALSLSLSTAFAYDDEGYDSDNFNTESARDILQGGEASEEFLAAKERLELEQDRAGLSNEEAAMMMLSNQSEMN